MADPKKTSVPTPTPKGGSDFDKFIRDNLANVVVDVPTADGGSAPPPPEIRPVTPVYPRPTPHTPTPPMNPEEAFRETARGYLRLEEERLAKLPKPPPLPNFASAGPASYLSGATQPEVVVRDGYDPLHYEVYKVLRNLVAGGVIFPGAVDMGAIDNLLGRLRKAVEATPKVETPPTTTTDAPK